MRTHIKLLLAAATVVVALSAAVGAASARRIQVSELLFRQIWRELIFSPENGTFAVNCAVTLEGSFHSKSLSKVSGQLVGYITRATVAACTGALATALTETLPWHVRYVSFAGVLPRIERVTLSLVGAAWRISNLSNVCLTQTTAANPAIGITTVDPTTGQVTTLRSDETVLIPIPACPFTPNGKFSGVSEVFAGATGTTRVTLRLVQ